MRGFPLSRIRTEKVKALTLFVHSLPVERRRSIALGIVRKDRNQRVWTAFASLAAAVLCASCGQPNANSMAATDGPSLVSLNPCLDAIVVEIAAPEQILALSHYSSSPGSSSLGVDVARQFGVTGGTAEEIVALKPDLALASSFIAPATRAAIERVGIAVKTFGSPLSLEESVAQVRELAGTIGRGPNGEVLVEAILASETAAEDEPIEALLWQPGQIVPGAQTLVSDLLDRSGFVSQTSLRGLGQADYVSLEALLADPPELVLVAGDSVGQSHPLLGEIPNTRVEAFDPSLFYCGGPSIIRANRRLAEIRETLR